MIIGTPELHPGTSGRRRPGPLVWTVLMLGAVAAAAAWTMLGLPGLAAAQAEETPLWSAEIKVVKLENGAAGAVSASDFSNQAGSAGLKARWLYHYAGDGKLRLSFTDGAETAGHVLQVGHLSLPFDEDRSGDNSFTWDNVAVDWAGGQTLTARIVPGSETDSPATGLPDITGRAQVGETLTADVSGISDPNGLDNVDYAYQWQADGTDISLATNSAYTPVPGDLGKTIRVKVTFKDDKDNDEELTSEPTAAVIAANTQATGAPDISGDPKVRQTLTAGVSGIIDSDGITTVEYIYQWTADDTDIEGATGSTYKLTSAELTRTITVTVSFTDDAGNHETLTSAATTVVADGPPDAPAISSVRRLHVGMLRIKWNDTEDTTGYELQYQQYGINWVTLPYEPLNYQVRFDGSQALADGLPDTAVYNFRVRAVNDAGNSEWSESYANTFSPAELYGVNKNPRPEIAGAPSKPQNLRVSGGDHLQIKVSWTEPEDSGDSDVTGYRVEFQPQDSEYWHFLAATKETSYTHLGLSPGRTFYYRVSAFNEKGRGQNSARARGTSVSRTGSPIWTPPVHQIAEDWALLPEGVDWQHGDRFRLMFITSESRGANSTDIEEYNRFVQQAAEGGHTAIQDYSDDFRVVASTVARDATDNTGTSWNETNPGLPVYWLQGTKVADDYQDFYDGHWDDPRFEPEWHRQSVIGRLTFYSFDASRGTYVYTDEHGVSMYQRHCVGVSWATGDENGNLQTDLLPCIATGSLNDGTRHYSDIHERCGYYLTLGTPCAGVAFGRPTRILPEEQGQGKPTVFTDPTLAMGRRESRPAYITTPIEDNPEWSVELTNMSEGHISLEFLFYAMSPIFELKADPALTVADADATEGDDATLDFAVTLHPAAEAEVTVDYATQDGTATAGSDYTSTSGTLTFAAGETSKTVSVPITDDSVEDDGETFTLTLSNASGADVDDSEATGTIRNTEANTAAGGAPTIAGTPQANQTLTANTSGITDANGLTNVSWQYRWLADGADIGSATGSTYTVTIGDVGKRISVRVTFNDDDGNAESLTSAQTVAVAATVPTAPQSLTLATGDQDQQLVASWQAPSSNGGSDVTGYRVQWKESTGSWDTEADVSQATETGTTHTITGLTGGVEYAVRVMATNGVGDGPASAEAKGTPSGAASEQTTEAENSAPTGLPTISGTPQVEQTLTADTSEVDDADGLTSVSWEYQWTAGGTDIEEATGSTYTLTHSEQGKTIQVKVSFTDDADNEETLTSEATIEVAAKPNTAPTGLPTIGGTPQVDQTLTADTSPINDEDGLTNVSYRYQWLAAGADIAGATGASHTLIASEQGKTIQVRVTFTDDRGNDESLTSEATVAVAAKPVPLTVRLKVAAPASHDGSSAFTFEIEFSEEFGLSYRALKFDAFNVTGGSVEKAQRTDKPSNIPWRIEIKPQGNGAVTIELPATTDCGATGAICTGDGRKLSNSLSFIVPGPGQ